MKNTYRNIILTIALTFAAISFTGCNTIKGVGEDVEAAGEGIQDASN